MNFGTLEYAVLLMAAMGVSWLLRERHLIRNLTLLALSYYFFARWNGVHPLVLMQPERYSAIGVVATAMGLLLLSSTVDYFVALRIHKEEAQKTRKRFLLVSVILNLGILCTFKYFNFFSTELRSLFGTKAFPYLHLAAPMGLSFYTFQTISYTVDVYRKKTNPASRYSHYLLYLAFFPQLVMGPIVRAHTLLPQLEKSPRLTAAEGSNAIYRIGVGLVKKLVIADFLRAQIVDPVFSNPGMYSSLETLTAVYAYAFQIYADFAGYSDIAIGSAALLGIEIPENFRAPYKSKDLREFWQRWHITLSTWLRDYLYIPLGGSRGSAPKTYVNLMITMILGGLWHGPALTFVVWGAIHGTALVTTRLIQRSTLAGKIPVKARGPLGLFATFHVVAIAWIFFRATDFDGATAIFESLFAFDFSATNIRWTVILVLALAAGTHFLKERWITGVEERFHRLPAPVQASLFVMAVAFANRIASTDVAPFIYSNF